MPVAGRPADQSSSETVVCVLTPSPFRLSQILQIVADKSGHSVEDVQTAAYANAVRLFSFKGSKVSAC